MPRKVKLPPPANPIVPLMDAVSAAARNYEARWTVRSLQAIDPELYKNFTDQLDDYTAALVTGTEAEARAETQVMIRGWIAITARMEKAAVTADACLRGYHEPTDTMVCIGTNPAARDYALGLNDGAVWVTPDEVAAMVGGVSAIKDVKAVFPSASVTGIRQKVQH